MATSRINQFQANDRLYERSPNPFRIVKESTRRRTARAGEILTERNVWSRDIIKKSLEEEYTKKHKKIKDAKYGRITAWEERTVSSPYHKNLFSEFKYNNEKRNKLQSIDDHKSRKEKEFQNLDEFPQINYRNIELMQSTTDPEMKMAIQYREMKSISAHALSQELKISSILEQEINSMEKKFPSLSQKISEVRSSPSSRVSSRTNSPCKTDLKSSTSRGGADSPLVTSPTTHQNSEYRELFSR